jgi:hypothetical protein
MRSDLLNAVLAHLAAGPAEATIEAALQPHDVAWLTRAWARARFAAQQNSILHGHPDDPDYGRGNLWYYALRLTTVPDGQQLSFVRVAEHDPSVRELILLASVNEVPIRYEDLLGNELCSREFYIVRQRMLGEAKGRQGIALPLRPAVRLVQLINYEGRQCLRVLDVQKFIRVKK